MRTMDYNSSTDVYVKPYFCILTSPYNQWCSGKVGTGGMLGGALPLSYPPLPSIPFHSPLPCLSLPSFLRGLGGALSSHSGKSNLVNFSSNIYLVATISIIFLRINLPNFMQYQRSPCSGIILGNGIPPKLGDWRSPRLHHCLQQITSHP